MLANHLGLSTATVSRALHKDTSVNAKTRDRVLKAARKLGWRPNFIVNTVMREIRTKPGGPAKAIIGVIGRQPQRAMAQTPTYLALVEATRQAGFTLDYFDLGDYGSELARFEKVLLARGINSLIMMGDALKSIAPVFDWDNFCAVILSSEPQPMAFNQIGVHRQHDVNLAYRRLAALGYRNIGLVALKEHWDEDLLAGYLLGQHDHPPRRPMPPLLLSSNDRASLRSWLRVYRPDAIISTGSGSKVFGALQSLGIRVPQDLAVAVLHVNVDGKQTNTVAGVLQPWDVIAETLVEQIGFLVSSFQRGPLKFPVVHAVEGEWIDGSTAPERKVAKAASKAKRPAGRRR